MGSGAGHPSTPLYIPYIYIYIYIESEKTPQKIHSNPQKVGRLNKMLLVVVNLAWISNGTGGVLLHTCSIQVEYQGGGGAETIAALQV